MRKKSSLLIFCLLYFFLVNAQWSLTGNAISTGNFLGTTNAQNLVFKANSTNAGYIDVTYHNTAFGLSSGGTISSTAIQNTAFGNYALQMNTSGTANVAVGYLSLPQNSSGSTNTGVGIETLYANTTGSSNTAVGALALYHNTTANYNNAFGADALVFNTTGAYNNAFGAYALYSNINGNDNCAMGYQSLYSNTSGSDNIALGEQSLNANTTGSSNIAIGYQTMMLNTTGTQNVGVGVNALYDNDLGSYNVGVGSGALQQNKGGNGNSGLGYEALYYNSTGNYNTGIGYFALTNNSTGTQNVAAGYSAGLNNTTGSENTFIGSEAGPSTAGLTNSTAIGYFASTTASNQVVIGNGAVTSIGGYATSGWTVYPSDRRFKKNVKENVPGLEFIKLLRPITYNIDVTGLNNFLHPASGGNPKNGFTPSPIDQDAITKKEKITCTGFIAQEVEAAAKKIGYDFSGLVKPEDDKGLYGLGYSMFVVPLVKSVQQLSSAHDSLKSVATNLQSQIDDIQQQINELLAASDANGSSNAAILRQNAPNPFNSNTVISYFIPSKATSSQLTVSNVNGQIMKIFPINNKGEGLITISGGELAAGTYFYTLLINGNRVSTKKMVLTK